MTIGELRQALAGLPDDREVLIDVGGECDFHTIYGVLQPKAQVELILVTARYMRMPGFYRAANKAVE